jgi:serine/threonine-protein kinase
MAAPLARSHPQVLARGAKAHGSLLRVGDLLAGKYRVERILGEGGMGVVVAAHHELLDRPVAVKLLYQELADREAQARLLFEAQACAMLPSEHVARVLDVDTGPNGLPFIVMELLEGFDLAQVMDRRGALPAPLVADYVLQALEGLAHAHARGIVHRDLKPSNLFLATGSDGNQVLKLLDFGVSKATDPTFDGVTDRDRRSEAKLTGARAVLGSPPYMSPEQVRSPKSVDTRTDIWSLGVVMYELLTNSMPFGGDEMTETFAEILEKDPEPPTRIVDGVPPQMESVVLRCLAKDRNERFSDVLQIAEALAPLASAPWRESAARISVTLARVGDDASSGFRTRRGLVAATQSEGAIIPSSPGRRHEAPSELFGSANTIVRGSLGSRTVRMLALSGAFTLAAVVLFVLAWGSHTRSATPSPPVARWASKAAPAPSIAVALRAEPSVVPAPAKSTSAAPEILSHASRVPPAPHAAASGPSVSRKVLSPANPLPEGLPRSRD